jgi:GNAT acetyltransferase-like protein
LPQPASGQEGYVEAGADAWDDLVASAPEAEIYHSNRWLAVLADGYGVEVVRIAREVDGQLEAGLPVTIRKAGPFLLAGSPLSNVATPQLGPIARPGAAVAPLLADFDDFQRRRGVGFAEVIGRQPELAEQLRARGYQVEAYQTHVLELTGRTADDVWKGFEGRARTSIRKAERAGVEVSLADEAGFLSAYLSMSMAVYARQRRLPPIPQRFYEALWSQFGGTGRLWALVARHQGRMVAAGLFLFDRGRLFYQDGASYPEHNALGANALIQWAALQRAISEGAKAYDLVGAGNPSIARFKASFGGRLVERPLGRRANSLPARAALRLYRRGSGTLRQLRFLAKRAR